MSRLDLAIRLTNRGEDSFLIEDISIHRRQGLEKVELLPEAFARRFLVSGVSRMLLFDMMHRCTADG